jgi:hypothetical protein
MLGGEIAYRRGEHDAALAHLRAGIALEDSLPYDEPLGLMQPARHGIGALLLEPSRAAEAEAMYREDLGLGGAWLARRSIPTTRGLCAGCPTASSSAVRPRRPPP